MEFTSIHPNSQTGSFPFVGESLGSPQLFVIEPKATPSSTGLSQHPAAPRDPRASRAFAHSSSVDSPCPW